MFLQKMLNNLKLIDLAISIKAARNHITLALPFDILGSIYS